ncbi:S-protein homolog 6-like [Humulus lupulus]|uniref:S-protein homolog 6-like n=1 Tax=Humulus lupulus TaxID=3486 RepID=UPI002B410A2E|nr:S-protein homolog 6-like [Humulus lupulus]
MAKSKSTITTQGIGDIYIFKTTVQIHNELDNGTKLTVHCKSKDDDLGSHILGNKEVFEWKFRINFAGTTLFYCGLTWEGASRTFDIFDAPRDSNRCASTCIWRIRNDGVHGYHDIDQKDDDIHFKWDQDESQSILRI